MTLCFTLHVTESNASACADADARHQQDSDEPCSQLLIAEIEQPDPALHCSNPLLWLLEQERNGKFHWQGQWSGLTPQLMPVKLQQVEMDVHEVCSRV